MITDGVVASEGDCGVVLKPDGSFKVFSLGVCKGTHDLTDAKRTQGAKLIALTFALQNADAMDALMRAAAASQMTKKDKIVDYAKRH